MTTSAPASAAAPVDTSFEAGVAEIANLLDLAPETDSQEEEEAQTQAETTVEAGAEAEQLEGADEAATDDEAPETPKGGQFLPDTGKTTLKDGTVISLADLKRGYLSQRDYYRQTDETRSQRETNAAENLKLSERAAQLAAREEALLSAHAELLPVPPDESLLQTDPVGYMQEKAAYDRKAHRLHSIWLQKQAADAGRAQETEQQKATRQREEAGRLLEAIPEFKDRAVYNGFLSDVGPVMAEYGYAAEDLAPLLEDHRAYKALRDLVFLAKARANKGKVQQTLKDKPALPVMQGGKRVDPNARNSREAQQRTAKLRQSGSLDDFIDAVKNQL